MGRISKNTADSAVTALKTKRKEVEEQIASLDRELKKPEALTVQKKLQKKQGLIEQLNEIDSGINEIRSAQEKPGKTGGGCSG